MNEMVRYILSHYYMDMVVVDCRLLAGRAIISMLHGPHAPQSKAVDVHNNINTQRSLAAKFDGCGWDMMTWVEYRVPEW